MTHKLARGLQLHQRSFTCITSAPKQLFAGTTGEVLASGTVPRCAAQAALQLQANPTPPETEDKAAAVLRAVVESAHGMPDVTTMSAEHDIVAQFSEAPSSEVLPATLPSASIPHICHVCLLDYQRAPFLVFKHDSGSAKPALYPNTNHACMKVSRCRREGGGAHTF